MGGQTSALASVNRTTTFWSAIGDLLNQTGVFWEGFTPPPKQRHGGAGSGSVWLGSSQSSLYWLPGVGGSKNIAPA